MTQRGPFLFFVIVLFVGGVATALYRHEAYHIPFLPDAQQSVWQVEARVEYQAAGGPTQVYLTLPPEQPRFRFISGSESSASSGYGFEISRQAQQRRAHWTRRFARGQQVLFYRTALVEDPQHGVAAEPPGEPAPRNWDDPHQTAALQLLESVIPTSADPPSLAQQLAFTMNRAGADQNLNLLLDRYRPALLMTRLLNTAGVPARTVQALELQDGRRRQELRELVQVWDGEAWQLFDPRIGQVNDRRLLLWRTATPSVLDVMGGSQSRVTFSIIRQTQSALALADQQAAGLSLYSLPVAEQSMFKLIMLLPVGALVVVLMRILVGVKTSGTFMPVLIALAFLQTQLVPGLVSFVSVVALGLVVRSYLSSLNLLLVSRIATLVVVVIGIVTAFSLLSHQLDLMGGTTITFFPMIILAWTIERLSIVWEEQGPREVAVQGGGSLLVAVLAFLVMDQPLVRHLAFNFPELTLGVLAVILLLGRYTGYRLLELRRFAVFAR
ncbi:MAG: inactive transglutaminase family protein [Pseudomonadota bacterium]